MVKCALPLLIHAPAKVLHPQDSFQIPSPPGRPSKWLRLAPPLFPVLPQHLAPSATEIINRSAILMARLYSSGGRLGCCTTCFQRGCFLSPTSILAAVLAQPHTLVDFQAPFSDSAPTSFGVCTPERGPAWLSNMSTFSPLGCDREKGE